jgi:hypothetical protein
MTKLRLCRLLSLLLAVTLLLALPGAALANGVRGKGFNGVVKHIESNYRAKKTKIPCWGWPTLP